MTLSPAYLTAERSCRCWQEQAGSKRGRTDGGAVVEVEVDVDVVVVVVVVVVVDGSTSGAVTAGSREVDDGPGEATESPEHAAEPATVTKRHAMPHRLLGRGPRPRCAVIS